MMLCGLAYALAMPSNAVLKSMNAIHRGLLKISGGRVGYKFAGMPVLELTTTGRKSGVPRSCMLTSPLQIGDAILIVASRGGDDRHPDWFVNLQANPEVIVKLQDGEPHKRHARIANAQERADAWPKITSKFKNYAGYQEKTDREIPVVYLERA